ncbi:NUDIX domain-containing protein [Neobacillus sp. FSL H8-0543]|uniref:NUDIX domain-containing protein n=1 Tax=Neobacillus sp. FSL H8-0543 TaxID=2954672 RepID=UPI003159852A
MENREIGGEIRRYCPSCHFVFWGNSTISVGALVIKNDRVLVVRRMKNPGKGKWTNPGGFVEQRENIETAVIREIVEETGIVAKVNKIVAIADLPGKVRHDMYIVFLLDYVEGEPNPDGVEVDAAKFCTLEELQHLEVANFTKRLIELALQPNRDGFHLTETSSNARTGYRLWAL